MIFKKYVIEFLLIVIMELGAWILLNDLKVFVACNMFLLIEKILDEIRREPVSKNRRNG